MKLRVVSWVVVSVVFIMFASGCNLLSSGSSPIPPADNLVTNPGFETVGENGIPQGWRIGWSDAKESASIEASSEFLRNGKYSLKMTTAEDDEGTLTLSQDIELISGFPKYEASAWVMVPSSIDRVRLTVRFFDGESNEIGERLDEHFKDLDIGSWQQIKTSVDIDPRVTNITLFLRAQGPGTVYFDDIVFGVAQ